MNNYILCPSCRTKNPPEARACIHCGKALNPLEACPFCKSPQAIDARFCSVCGMPIEERRRLQREGIEVKRSGGLLERSRRLKGKEGRVFSLSPLKGISILVFVLILSLLLASGITILTYGIVILTRNIANPITLFPVAFLIPYLLGYIVDRWGWLLCLSYALIFTFLVMPFITWYDSYMWSLRGIKGHWQYRPFSAIAFGIGMLTLSVLFSFLGSNVTKRKRKPHIVLNQPLATLVPIVIISLLISSTSWYIVPLIEGQGQGVIKYEQYKFQITKPFGWYASEISPPPGSEGVRKGALARIDLDKYHDSESMSIYIYSRMPFTGEPLTSYSSREEVYERLKSMLQDVVNNPTRYLYQSKYIHELAEFAYYGKTNIRGISAIRLLYREFQDDEIPEEPFPKTTPYPDIVVYKSPYLYWLEFHAVNEKTYKKIVNSFKFIK